jgi:L-fuculose-phosphate aldolase
MTEAQLRRELCDYARLMYDRDYVTGSEGNVSCLLPGGRMLITPSRAVKHFLRPSDLVVTDMQGRKIGGKRNASTERFTHLAVYRDTAAARAIVHAHPEHTLLFSAAGENPFAGAYLSESAMFVRNVCFLPFALPSTDESAKLVEGHCEGTNVIVLERHGTFTWGQDIASAFCQLEVLEKTARIAWKARAANLTLRQLPQEALDALRAVKY